MDLLLQKQKALLDQLATSKRNFKKTGADRRTHGYVSNKIVAIKDIWQSFSQNDSAIRLFNEHVTSSYATSHVYDDAEEDYSAFCGDLSDIIHAFEQAEYRVNHPPTQPQTPPTPASHILSTQSHASSIRLPQISLPTFSGDYESWSAFHDMFVSLIHTNPSLTDVQKLHYLKSNLHDQAANLLRHTQITNENYSIAWDSLKARYANKRILVNTQLKALFGQPSYQTESALGIRDMIDTSQDCLNALRVLNVDVNNWDPLLLFMLVLKMSSQTHAAWEMDQEGSEELPTFNAFMEFMENRFRMLESLATRTPSTSHATQPLHQVQSHAVVSAASTSNACNICSGPHYIRLCPNFIQLSVAERRNTVKLHRICFNCLTPGHLVLECKNRMNCQKCNKRHHTLLHDIENSPQQAVTPNLQSSTPRSSSSS